MYSYAFYRCTVNSTSYSAWQIIKHINSYSRLELPKAAFAVLHGCYRQSWYLTPQLVILALAFFTKLQVEVPGTSQVPSPTVVEVAPGPQLLLLTPMSGTVLDPGLGETMVTSTTRVQVLNMDKNEELDPGPEPSESHPPGLI